MSNHLFLFTIGPVQSFIAQARKTQDLYAGSQLLSVLTETAMNYVQSKNGKIIFPSPTIESKPNRFVAKVDLPTNDLQQLGKEVEKAVREKWQSLAKDILEKKGGKPIPNGWEQQIEQHLKVHWVFHPIKSDYKTAFQELESLLAAVKRTTAFEQFPEQGRKCSVDGQLNVKFYRQAPEQRDDQRIKDKHLFSQDNLIVDDKKTSLAILQPGEGLSAVSFVKRGYRKGNRSDEFESTADIALRKAIVYWKNPKNNILDYRYFKDILGKDDNTQFLYEDNLTQQQLKKQGVDIQTRQRLPELRELQQKLEQAAKAKKIHLCKYYALLLFDGDGMGKLLGGDYLEDGKKLEDFHKAFSEKLGDFAAAAKDYLDANSRGRTVYAGGDDFMGFVNLESLFEVLDHFKKEFKNLVSDPLQDYLNDREITFSAGICIAHYKEPLSLVLKRLRELEKKSKEFRPEKNAFAIGVIKGSGEDHQTAWGLEHWSAAKELVHLLRDETFSNTFIKNFQRTFTPLQEVDQPIPEDMRDMYRTELLRLAERSANRLKLSKEKQREETEKLVAQIWDNIDFNSEKATLENFFELLNICDFLHRTLNPDYAEQTTEQPSA